MTRFLVGFASGVAITLALIVGGLVAIGHTLAVKDRLAEADAIVAISGDTGARVATATDLWRRGYASRMVFSGAALDPDSPSSGELMKRQAIAYGVPAELILVEGGSATTAENAEGVAEIMAENGLRSAILVTSPYHQRRASLHFAKAFARYGFTLGNHPADDPTWDPTLWWAREPSRTLTVVEVAKLAVEAWEGRLLGRQAAAAPR